MSIKISKLLRLRFPLIPLAARQLPISIWVELHGGSSWELSHPSHNPYNISILVQPTMFFFIIVPISSRNFNKIPIFFSCSSHLFAIFFPQFPACSHHFSMGIPGSILMEVPTIYKAYARGYTPKIWPEMWYERTSILGSCNSHSYPCFLMPPWFFPLFSDLYPIISSMFPGIFPFHPPHSPCAPATLPWSVMVKVLPVLTVVAPFRETAPVPVVKVPVPGETGHGFLGISMDFSSW